jgi:hypothetical protein
VFVIVAVCWDMADTLQVFTPRISICIAHLALPAAAVEHLENKGHDATDRAGKPIASSHLPTLRLTMSITVFLLKPTLRAMSR